MPMTERFKTKRLSDLKSVARKQGGTVLDRTYHVLRKPLKVRCANGHSFSVSAKNLLRGLWCPTCRPLGRQNDFLTAAQKIARKHGGRCLSSTYQTARLPLKWQCKQKHRWQASFDNVANKKSWCPQCSVDGASDRKKDWWRKRLRRR